MAVGGINDGPMTDWKLFEIETPDGRIVRHRHESLDIARSKLLPGYKVLAEVFGASADDKGGLVDPLVHADGHTKSIMGTLLDAHGSELIRWLCDNGFKPSTKDCLFPDDFEDS